MSNEVLASVRESTVKVQLRIFPLNIWQQPTKLIFQIQTRVFDGAESVENHKWNKTLKRTTNTKALAVFDRWEAQLKAENLQYWIQ